MTILKERNTFIGKIAAIRSRLDSYTPQNPKELLAWHESYASLSVLEQCFLSSNEQLEENLKHIFKTRWERIRGSYMCYTQRIPGHPSLSLVNNLFIDLAHVLFPLPETEKDIDKLGPGEGPYFILMPTLEIHHDVYGTNIHNFKLQEIILSDDERTVIPLINCLKQATLSDSGELRHLVCINEYFPLLSENEIERMKRHSEAIEAYYEAVKLFIHFKFNGDKFIQNLRALATGLSLGGTNRRGQELDSGKDANIAIVNFKTYWDTIPSQQQHAIYEDAPELTDIFGRLFRPRDADYTSTIYCVQTMGDGLRSTIERMAAKNKTFKYIHKVVEAKEEAARKGLDLFPSTAVAPKISFCIANLPRSKKIFLLTELLQIKNDPQLKEAVHAEILNLDAAAQREIIFPLFKRYRDQEPYGVLSYFINNAPHLLIKALRVNDVRCLNELGLSTGQFKQANQLLFNGIINKQKAESLAADIETILTSLVIHVDEVGASDNTPFYCMLLRNHPEAAMLLSERGANELLRRNRDGKNALDLVDKHTSINPKLLLVVLMKALVLPVKDQRRLLYDRPYNNILEYANAQAPSLLLPMLSKIVTDPSLMSVFGLHSSELTPENQRLLMTAVRASDAALVQLILDHLMVDLTAKDQKDYTPLCIALTLEQPAITRMLLIKAPAALLLRNNLGKNALDMVVEKGNRELIKVVLEAALKLEPLQQKILLQNVAGGLYEDILSYVAMEQSDLFEEFCLLAGMKPEHVANATRYLKAINFDNHLHGFKFKLNKLREAKNEKLIDAASNLVKELCREKIACFQTGQTAVFKDNCIKIAQDASPILGTEPLWQKAIKAFLIALTFVISLPLLACGIFSMKNNFAKSLDKMEQDFHRPAIEV